MSEFSFTVFAGNNLFLLDNSVVRLSVTLLRNNQRRIPHGRVGHLAYGGRPAGEQKTENVTYVMSFYMTGHLALFMRAAARLYWGHVCEEAAENV